MKRLNAVDITMMVLLVVGGLNWGLVGIFNFDLVAAIFGDMSVVSRIVYALVGIAAGYTAVVFPSRFTMRKPMESPQVAE